MKIKDKSIKPYIIIKSTDGYSIGKKTKRKDQKGERIYSNEGYFSSVYGCLMKIIKLKAEQGKDVISLKEYMESLKSVTKQVTKSFNLDKQES